ncbi:MULTISPECIES: ATP-binding protein [Saccharothrix]|uniref:ATP-binding protein n=1 Tax=Saccharothrix TaxID=2071 RepID=UPI00093F466F|nr:ATP-binding protein [Saccharothrix sp. CB00851]OKI28661.1 hypothetical protein A6A25_31120 [Saccharothrix sp. CB00851]
MSTGDDTVVLVMKDAECFPSAEIERWVRQRMVGWLGHEALLVGTVVGELLDNARRHGAAPYVLALSLDESGDELTIRVRSRERGHGAGWSFGAGLLIVDCLTGQWGVRSEATGTTVWAKVRFDD